MDHGACYVIYLDRRANDEHVQRETLSQSLAARTSKGSFSGSYFNTLKPSSQEVRNNVEAILSLFNEGM
jgi:hypothetical protein